MIHRVFFETIIQAHRPLVAWYLARGDQVSVFDLTYQLKSIPWLRRLIHQGRVERIYVHPNSRAGELAIEAAEWFFPQMEKEPLVSRLGDFVGSEEAGPIFKHALVEHLSRYFYVRLFLQQLACREGPSSEVTFIPSSFSRWDRVLREWCRERLDPIRGIRIPTGASLFSTCAGQCSQVLSQARRYLVCTWYVVMTWLAHTVTRAQREAEPRHFRYAYAIDSAFQIKFTGGRRFNFLLDDSRLTKENTVFLVGKPGEGPWVQEARQSGYQVVVRSDYSSLRGFLRYPPRTRKAQLLAQLRVLWTGVRSLLRAPEWIHEAATAGLWVLTKEANLLDHLRFDHYIYANHYGLIPRWRNSVIRTKGAQSWWFAYSNGGGFLYQEEGEFAGGTDFGGLHRFWSYENADHFVAPCSQLIDYHRRHRQQIRQYHDVGNIWSEQILQIEKAMDRSVLRERWFGPLHEGRKIIGWFDTSFIEAPNSPSTFREAILWYTDILRLARERDDLLMVIKPSKDEAYYISPRADHQWANPREGQKIINLWALLRVHPRVQLLESSADSSNVIAASDLTVTFCFTSVSAEALGARKRAIWYEPGQRWRDTLYGRVPLLVAHGYDELRALIQRLLFGMSEEEYEAFLDGTVRGLIENFVDGKGLSRFRALLAGESHPEALQGIPSDRPVSALSLAGPSG